MRNLVQKTQVDMENMQVITSSDPTQGDDSSTPSDPTPAGNSWNRAPSIDAPLTSLTPLHKTIEEIYA